MIYRITGLCYNKIYSFYENVLKKYKNTYTKEEMHNHIDQVIANIYKIENGLLPRTPFIQRWVNAGLTMAKCGRWYYAYRKDGDVIRVEDACYEKNMHDSVEPRLNLIESLCLMHRMDNLPKRPRIII